MGVRAHVLVEDEVPDNLDPGRVVGEVVVVLGGQALDLGQARVGDVGEVVVLVVVAHVEEDKVERAVVGVRGLPPAEQVVLRDEVAGQRVQPQPQQGPGHQVHQRLQAEGGEDDVVEGELADEVDQLPARDGLGALVEGTESVDERVDGQPDHLGQRVPEEVGLQAGGDVHVVHLLSQVAVVVGVVLLVGDGHGDGDRQVAPDAQHPVHPPAPVPVGQVVSDLVDGAAQGVVEHAAKAVGQDEEVDPGDVLDEPADDDLGDDLGGDDVGDAGVVAHELLDLRVLAEDLLAAGGVRLLQVLPLFVGVVDLEVQGQEVEEPLEGLAHRPAASSRYCFSHCVCNR